MQKLNNFKQQNKMFEITKDNFKKIKLQKTYKNKLTKIIVKQPKKPYIQTLSDYKFRFIKKY